MRKLCLSLFFISFISMACMTGHWESMNKSSTFSIDINQSGEHIRGKYCFITNNGNRVDCVEQDDADNISGSIKSGVAKVQYESTFGGQGRATIVLKDKKMIYTIDDKTPFIQENMSVPNEIQLTRTR
ncbi:hypothetical protein ZQ34_005151 [Salmonella enterica subsp. salamae]|uniref:Lipoprotein n=1 Tax=Salmonella enterica subsp. salamae TaxID=59202 RepID=A0A702L6B3_SALER|nr:hypothetical protein [Salmonella enterica]EDU0502835.1 hypothetical protein [Salmonella enterica subsp. salamae]EKR2077859.1 hypothetical protein [Salmonella enterica subsp. salamae serovar 9,46:l,w:e,n,x]EDV1507052.1 hypothetical protein [Salmonella enterica subsp. salamae]EEI9684649.1 hypothetical protein [Salmonella enterica]